MLETAWNDNLASAAVVLKPARHRFVFARAHVPAARQGTLSVTVTPNQRGRLLVAHPRYRVVLRLWVSYTPDGGHYRTIGFFGLHLPGYLRQPRHRDGTESAHGGPLHLTPGQPDTGLQAALLKLVNHARSPLRA